MISMGLRNRVDHTEAGLKSIKEVEIPANVNRLYLGKNEIEKIEGLEHINKLVKLKLYYNKISKIEGLKKKRMLEDLGLSNNKITKIENLEDLTTLKDLWLDGNNISRIENLEHQRNLVVLHINNNNISKIENLENAPNLRTLYLSGNNIGKIENISHLTQLKALGLSNNNIAKIENLENLKNLKILRLSGNPIKLIEGLENFKKLKQLWLDDCNIEVIENLESLDSLKYLHISGNNISNLDPLKKLPNLVTLTIGNNKFHDLSNFPYLSKIKSLSLKGSKLSSLKGVEKCDSLTTLNLENIEVNGLPENLRKELKDDRIIDVYMMQEASKEQISREYKSLLQVSYDKIFNSVRNKGEVLILPSRKILVFILSEILTNSRFSPADICMYCGKQKINVAETDYSVWLREELDNLIHKINKKLPRSRRVKDKHESFVSFQRVYFDVFMTTKTTIQGVKGKKLTHTVDVEKINSIFVPGLVNPLCKNCAKDFFSKTKSIFNSIKTWGRLEKIRKSVWDAFTDYESMLKTYI
ncbi:MAG: hypothetical protein GF364_16230 [Candidatus Lokiarchaeota archaeon]|nr:hypothetical protein [Candidatus Lokiarchaeota archaeon]